MRFEQISDNEIRDHQTGLVWRRDYKVGLTWQQALDYAKSLGDDWHLPTIDELETLLNRERFNPASDFPDVPSACFWSSSSIVDNPYYAWLVNFNSGYVSHASKAGTLYARCVRDKE